MTLEVVGGKVNILDPTELSLYDESALRTSRARRRTPIFLVFVLRLNSKIDAMTSRLNLGLLTKDDKEASHVATARASETPAD